MIPVEIADFTVTRPEHIIPGSIEVQARINLTAAQTFTPIDLEILGAFEKNPPDGVPYELKVNLLNMLHWSIYGELMNPLRELIAITRATTPPEHLPRVVELTEQISELLAPPGPPTGKVTFRG